MFSRTVISRKTRVIWKVRVMPRWKMLVGLEAGDVDAVVEHLAGVGLREPGEEVEGRRLARPVRADEPADLAAGNGEAAAVDGLHAAERLAQVARLQDDTVGGGPHQWTMPLRTQPRSIAKPTRPRGMKRATTTMNSP